MLLLVALCSVVLVQGFDTPQCIAKNCRSGTFCRHVVDATTGVQSPKCLKGGYCPQPQLWEAIRVKQCQRQCEEDTDCPGGQICCKDFLGCGRMCRDPLPEYTCDHLKCKDDEMCIMKENQCSRPVCFPTPTCIKSTCSPPCGTGLKCEMDVDPTCKKSSCQQVPRCLPKEPICSPPCAAGHSCVMKEPAGCPSPFCRKVPQCRAQCLAYPGGINQSNCIVSDSCSPTPGVGQAQCERGDVCCQTICGFRCLPPQTL
ncbi:keratin-associated protein 10-8-like [Pomacea canaliculata]|uniref:keratin-associated protein 10-8-like n=1 Tax=Pomacea canaliculata TaxID=400727 RepID=UPI000D73D69A|nr:keratin-associated protein 10-8-like [Pomacea canaliculata]